MRISEEDRFWSKVDKTDTCWLWIPPLTREGYGRFALSSRNKSPRRFAYAHRWAYERLVGPIPAGLQIDHLCRVRNCVNPEHLEPVTHRVNGLRGVSPTAINAAKTSCVAGHEFDEKNTYFPPTGGRKCRACHRVQEVARYRRKCAAMRDAIGVAS